MRSVADPDRMSGRREGRSTTQEAIDVADDESDPSTPLSLGDGLVTGAAVVGGALLSVLAYLRAFGEAVFPLGPDVFGYIWQTRVVGHAPLSAIEARPGVPVLGSVLAGSGITSDQAAPFVVAPVLIVALGFAVAVSVRLAFRLPGWTVGIIGFGVALWGGSLNLSQGHVANLLSVVCIVPAVLLVSLPSGSWSVQMIGAIAAIMASGLAHPGTLPFYAATSFVWVVLSVPGIVRARREGKRWWQEPSCTFTIALVVAGTIVALSIFGLFSVGVDEFTNIDDRVSSFGLRLRQVVRSVGLWVTPVTALAAIGVVAVWRLRRPSSGPLIRFGLALSIVSIAGALVAVVDPMVPGHRALGMILPLPTLAALGVVGIALAVIAWRSGTTSGRTSVRIVRVLVAIGAAIALIVFVVSPGLQRLGKRADAKPRGGPAQAIASYVAAVEPEGPVVVFVDPARKLDALSWRGRQNQIRALAPASSIDEIFLLVGRLGADGLPERGTAPGRGGRRAFEYAVERSWSAGGAALRDDPIIVVPQAYVRAEMWNQVASDPSRVVLPGLAVLRGPLESPAELVPMARLRVGAAVGRIIVALLALALLGAGYGVSIARNRRGNWLDGMALAPSVGSILVVLAGVAVAAVGGDPGGPLGLVAVGVGSGVGYGLAWRRWRLTRWEGRHVA